MSRRIQVRREQDINPKEKYAEAHKRFIQGEFTYNSHCLLRKLCENGEKEPKMHGVPLYKLMTEITKIMMMNELELLFFGATIQQMGWKIIENCLTPYIDHFTDITPYLQKDLYVKKMQLSLLLIAYIVKIYLNDDNYIYDFKIRDLAKNGFDKMYNDWVQKVQNNFKFSPKHMNKLFKELDKGKKKVDEVIIDYNMLVKELFKGTSDDQKPYYNKQIIQTFHQKQKQAKQSNSMANNNNQRGIFVQEEVQEYRMPTFYDRGLSGRSISGLGLGKRESLAELFAKEKKPDRINMIHNISQDEDFLGGGDNI